MVIVQLQKLTVLSTSEMNGGSSNSVKLNLMHLLFLINQL